MASMSAYGTTGAGTKATSSSTKPIGSNSTTYNPRSTYGVSNTTASNTKSNSDWAKQTIQDQNKTNAYLNTLNKSSGGGGGSSGGGSSSGGSSSGGGGGDYKAVSTQTDYENAIIDKIRSLLEEQKKQADEYLKSQYENQLSSLQSDWEKNQNQINLNKARGDRFLKNMYGDALSGVGLSNRARNVSNWNNNLAENNRVLANNKATALANYNSGLANNASQLAQGWYNYVMPVYTNRQNYSDSLANQLKLNEMDLDYRRYLANLG